MSFSRRDTASGRCEERSDEESLCIPQNHNKSGKTETLAEFTLSEANVLTVTCHHFKFRYFLFSQ